MHVLVKVNRVNNIEMVDSKPIHTFISSSLVHRYRMRLSKYPNYLKMINAKTQTIVGDSKVVYFFDQSNGYFPR